MLYYINLKYACFGIITKRYYVEEAPPIAKWMIGKRIDEIISWVMKKGGDIEKIKKGKYYERT